MVPTYLHYRNLDDWGDDDVVVVHLHDRETGRVRSHFPNRVSEAQGIEDAFDEAHRFLTQDPHIKRIGVFMDEGVEWWSGWGVLVSPN
ncbi:hypothetical protein GR247_23855 [Rhizobium leguminosarum]|nr:hypothetical protein [Rhizobium leguminosarum]